MIKEPYIKKLLVTQWAIVMLLLIASQYWLNDQVLKTSLVSMAAGIALVVCIQTIWFSFAKKNNQ